MKIQLLSPAGEIHRNKSGIFKTSLRYAPLTLTTLAALVPEDLHAEITIQDEGVQPLDLNFQADLVGITAITGTSQRAYQIADQLRAKGHTVILGGVHPTLLPEEAAPHADALVLGYAEKTWPQLLGDFTRGELKPRYFLPTKGALEGVPIARRDLLKKKHYTTVNSIEATRGCPHQCDFCVVPTAWKNTYAHRPIAEVVAELATFHGRHAVFLDLSPVEDSHYAKELYRAMIPLRMRWVALATTRIAEDAELLRLAAQSGCKGLLIGFESISQETLNQSHKHFHHATEYGEVVKNFTITASESWAVSYSVSITTMKVSSSERSISLIAPRSTCRGTPSRHHFPRPGFTVAWSPKAGSCTGIGRFTTSNTSSFSPRK